MIKLILSDVDGTLLRPGETKIPEDVFDTIHKLAEKNIKFAVASGRSYHELKRLFSKVDDFVYFISADGALCTYKEKNIFAKRILPNIMDRFQKLFAFERNLTVVCSGKYSSYILGANKQTQAKIKTDLHNHAFIVDSFSEIDEEIYKISIFGEPETAFGKKLLSGDVFGLKQVYNRNLWTEYVAPCLDKGYAAKKLMKHLGITSADASAIGDGENDLEMFKAVKYPYVMKSGSEIAVNSGAKITDDAITLLKNLCSKAQ